MDDRVLMVRHRSCHTFAQLSGEIICFPPLPEMVVQCASAPLLQPLGDLITGRSRFGVARHGPSLPAASGTSREMGKSVGDPGQKQLGMVGAC